MTSNREWWMDNDLPPESSSKAFPLTVLTNRMNVMEILSTRLVKPRAGYGTYYTDHLEDATGWIPLFQAPVATGVAARAAAEDPAAFPVLVSVPSMPSDARALGPDLWATRQVMALEALEVHFRNARELEEFKARKFANLPEDATYRVSPDLFGGDTDSSEIQRALETLASTGGLNEADFVREDRVSGALAIGAWAAGTIKGGRAPSTGHIGDLVPWLPGALLGHADVAGDAESLEVAVYTAVRDTIQGTPRGNGWNPRALLQEIKGRALGAAGGLEAEKSLSRYFTRIEQILRNEVEISVFQPTGITSAKALLLFLLRPEPKPYLEWDREHLQIDARSFIVGATYVGLLKGRSHLDALYRPRDLDVQLAGREAQALQELQAPIAPESAPDERRDEPPAPAALATPLVAEDQDPPSPLKRGPAAPTPAGPETDSPEVTPEAGGEAGAALTLADLVARLETEAPARAAVLTLVKKQGWDEVVSTTFTVPHLDINPGGKAIKVTVAGLVEPEYHFDVPRLLELLEEGSVTDRTRGQVLEMYTGTKPPRKTQPRKTSGKRRTKDLAPSEQDPGAEPVPLTTA